MSTRNHVQYLLYEYLTRYGVPNIDILQWLMAAYRSQSGALPLGCGERVHTTGDNNM
jgi:hypothetical protein